MFAQKMKDTAPLVPRKIQYLDNLKVYLTILVVIHHAIVTYGGPGSWYYSEKTTKMGALIAMNMIAATDQAFFMGFFFLMAALFTEASYDRKGVSVFFKDRLIRLGVPLVFYSFVLSPFLSYLVERYGRGNAISYWTYLHYFNEWIGFGVLWFVGALLFFTLAFIAIKVTSQRGDQTVPRQLPSNSIILFFAIGLAVVSFLVRIFYPVGWTLHPIGWQLGHFPQYVALFALGIIATRNKWLDAISPARWKKLILIPIGTVVIGFPLIYIAKEATHSELSAFVGGLHWQSLMFSLWEQVTGITIIVVLISMGKQRWNDASPFMKSLSRSAFAVYIFHPLWLIALSLVFKNAALDPAVKLLIVAPIAVVLTFSFAKLLLLIPGVNKII